MNLPVNFRVVRCLSCSFTFAIPERWATQRENDHRSYYCPKCKEGQYYPEESDKEKLQRMLTQERQCCISAREEANYFEKRAQGYKGYATKLKKKIVDN